MKVITLNVSYSQVSVFNGALENPFNDWTDRHVEQGFSWRPESVSLKTLIENGPATVEIQIVDSIVQPTGQRATSFPFTCPEGGWIEIASIADATIADIPVGSYQVVFETGFRRNEYWCRFSFLRNGGDHAEILKWDAGSAPDGPLLMDAKPA